MPFTFIPLNARLYLIRWEGNPTAAESEEFLRAFKHMLDTAPQPVATISDLRKGCITDVQIIRRLSQLCQSKKFLCGSSFSDIKGQVFAGIFERFMLRQGGDDSAFSSAEEALQYLESLHPTIAEGVDLNILKNTVAAE
ncbi:MAG: hypothetical protein OHK0023_10000 [Anaerolineae bacterium]